MEPYRTANDQVNHSCGILIDEGTSGAPSGRFREPRQSLLRVRSFRVDTASRPVEIGALLALSRGQTTSHFSCVFRDVFFSRDSCGVSIWDLHHLTEGPTARPGRYPAGPGSRNHPGALKQKQGSALEPKAKFAIPERTSPHMALTVICTLHTRARRKKPRLCTSNGCREIKQNVDVL